MEYLIIIAVAVGVALLDDRLRGKKKVPPPTLPQEIPRPQKRVKNPVQEGFEIPPLRNAPPAAVPDAVDEVLHAQEELRARWETARREAQRRKERQEREAQTAAMAAAVSAPAANVQPRAAVCLPLSADGMKQAIVLSEILGAPRALRRFPRR